MTKNKTRTLAQAAAFICAVVLAAATFAGANLMAESEYAKADAIATAHAAPVLALQKVVIVGHHV